MCIVAILVGAVLITGVMSMITSMRGDPPHMGPAMSGTLCGMVIVPQAMIAGPLVAILGLPITIIVGGLAAEWEQESIISRAIFGFLGFLLATVLVVVLSGGSAEEVGPFMIFPQLLTGVLSVFGIQCG